MIKTTSLELSKRLYELTGWDDSEWRIVSYKTSKLGSKTIPAYDLDWLLDRLPKMIDDCCLALWHDGLVWVVQYDDEDDKPPKYPNSADTPCDAACKLLITLIEQGLVKV